MESQARGGTRWKRFGLVMVPSIAATAAIGVALSQGALAASFAVSGQQFKVSTAKLENKDGFVQYGGTANTPDGPEPVAVSAFNTATITNLCQSVVVPTPFGDISLKLNAGGDPKNPPKRRGLVSWCTSVGAEQDGGLGAPRGVHRTAARPQTAPGLVEHARRMGGVQRAVRRLDA
jgi:hypothetical protein